MPKAPTRHKNEQLTFLQSATHRWEGNWFPESAWSPLVARDDRSLRRMARSMSIHNASDDFLVTDGQEMDAASSTLSPMCFWRKSHVFAIEIAVKLHLSPVNFDTRTNE